MYYEICLSSMKYCDTQNNLKGINSKEEVDEIWDHYSTDTTTAVVSSVKYDIVVNSIHCTKKVNELVDVVPYNNKKYVH